MSEHSGYEQVDLLGMRIHAIRSPDATRMVREWTLEPRARVRFVVTPNVQHSVLFQDNPAFREAYAHASLVIADGWPLVAASRLLGAPLPERVTGSDLLPSLFQAGREGPPLSVYLLGAAPGIGERAAAVIGTRWPWVKVAGTYSPPFGFERDETENGAILERIARAEPDVLVVGLGAPKQELWTYRFRDQIQAKVALCLGGTIDFIAGVTKRAPAWAQRLKLEWLHRAASEPRRLGPRYARDAVRFPTLVARTWLSGKQR